MPDINNSTSMPYVDTNGILWNIIATGHAMYGTPDLQDHGVRYEPLPDDTTIVAAQGSAKPGAKERETVIAEIEVYARKHRGDVLLRVQASNPGWMWLVGALGGLWLLSRRRRRTR